MAALTGMQIFHFQAPGIDLPCYVSAPTKNDKDYSCDLKCRVIWNMQRNVVERRQVLPTKTSYESEKCEPYDFCCIYVYAKRYYTITNSNTTNGAKVPAMLPHATLPGVPINKRIRLKVGYYVSSR